MRDATPINYFFNGSRTLFIIPLYQRKYAWQQKHCSRLFEDLKKIHTEGIRSHFFGSIVATKSSETEDDLLIIDGQQRITTLSILILAGINAVKNNVMELGNENIEKVKEDYLYATRRRVDRKIKLRPIEDDMKAYDALFTNDEKEFVENSGITSNYNLFYNLIKSCNLTFEELILAIEKLCIIEIMLDSKDNPQLIFESLNSCGKDLEEVDKVRNYLLMSLTHEQQEIYYHKYWSKIEKLTQGKRYEMFIRDYLTVKTGEISDITDLYFDFKSYDEKHKIDREDFLADMLKYAQFYNVLIEGKIGEYKTDRKLRQLASIGTSVHMPFLMSFYNHALEHSLSKDEIYEVFHVVENYWARRIMCNCPSNALQKLFSLLHSDVMKIYDRHETRGAELKLPYSDVLKYLLLGKKNTSRFPDDTEVKEWFEKREVYKMYSNYKYFLFERMENMDNPEADDEIIEKMRQGRISIEHIMPQTLTPQWKAELGDNYEEIHKNYLHTFCNLTLTGYNTSYSNHSFCEKKEGYIDKKGNRVNGFKDSALSLSNYLKVCNKWTLEEMKKRKDILMENFFYLWPMIKSSYQPLEKEYELVPFNDDDTELKGRTIVGFVYRGENHKVVSWKEMITQVCTLMYKENPTLMTYIATEGNWLHLNNDSNYSRIAENCYLNTSNDTNTKKYILANLFKGCGISPSVLEFKLIPLTELVFEENQD